MKNYVQVKGNKIGQVAIGFKTPPFDNAIEVSLEIAQNPRNWNYVDGKFVYTPKPEPEPQPQLPTIIERLQALEAAMLELILGGEE